MKVDLCNIESVIETEIKNKCNQKTIALSYAFALTSSNEIDFKKINQLIVNRWSMSGLDRVMKMALKLVE